MAEDFDTRVLLAGERHALRFADRLISPGGDVLGTYRRYLRAEALAPAATVRPASVPAGEAERRDSPAMERRCRVPLHGPAGAAQGRRGPDPGGHGSPPRRLAADAARRRHRHGPAGASRCAISSSSRPPATSASVFLEGSRASRCRGLVDDHHVLSCPSRWECWPSVMLEALEANRPVLATPTGGMVEMVAVPGAGWLTACAATARSPSADRLLERPEEIDRLIESESPRGRVRELGGATSPAGLRSRSASGRQRPSSLNGRPTPPAREPRRSCRWSSLLRP